MKCYQGFLTIKDELTKKEHPFFVKVRKEDIIQKAIPMTLKQTSGLYDPKYNQFAQEPNIYIGNDYTSYMYRTETWIPRDDYESWDPSQNYDFGENIKSSYTNGCIMYKFFNNRTYEITGNVKLKQRVSYSSTTGPVIYLFPDIVLPFEIPGLIFNVDVKTSTSDEYYETPTETLKIEPNEITLPDLNNNKKYKYIIGSNDYTIGSYENLHDKSLSLYTTFSISGIY